MDGAKTIHYINNKHNSRSNCMQEYGTRFSRYGLEVNGITGWTSVVPQIKMLSTG
jgi:hypothetical protein